MRRTLSRSPRPPFECGQLAQSRFEKPALIFAGLFFLSVAAFIVGFIAFLLFVEM
jgi:ABC-type multidrug transport system permease subunit